MTFAPDYHIENFWLGFKQSMINFANYKGPLAEHFAYGTLEKWQYEQAHAMHFYNHLLEVELES